MAIKACCQDEKNLVPTPTERPNMTLLVCSVCGARHWTLEAEAGHYNLEVKGV